MPSHPVKIEQTGHKAAAPAEFSASTLSVFCKE